MSGFDEQIEAVREQLQRSIDALAEPLDEMALAALDHLTKANEELRAEVELAKQEGVAETLQQIDCLTGGDGEYRLSTCPDRNCPDEDAMRKKIVARFDDLRAAIDRLTKERDWACERLDAMTTEVANRDERLSAMQDAIDEAVSRADLGAVVGRVITEPLRNLTKPEPEVDPLVAALREVLPTHNREVSKLWAANLRTALAARGGRVVFDGREG